MAQKVHLSRSQSGIPGLFTGNMMAWMLSAEDYERLSKDNVALGEFASRLGFALEDQCIDLVVQDGMLCLPAKNLLKPRILFFHYAEGDVDTFSWPGEVDPDMLVAAIYDEREMGNVPSSTTHVKLPDGRVLEIDVA